MKTSALVLLTSAALSLAPAAAGVTTGRRPAARPGPFLVGVVTDIVHNDYAHAWLSLYPAQQRVAPLAEYVACEAARPITGQLDRVTVVHSASMLVAVAGVAHRLRGAAVTIRIRIVDPGTGAATTMQHTFHAVPFRGAWKWILPADRYALYRDDACSST